MSEPIRVLQVFGALNRGGSESMIMNLYRNIDRTKVQFDFVKHTSEVCAFDEEIKSLGGSIYEAPRFNFLNYFSYRKWWNKFFASHPEYRIVHGHLFTIASIFFKEVHKYKKITIGHSHATKTPLLNVKTLLRRPFLSELSRYSDYRFACSKDAGQWIYGNESFTVVKNAIDSSRFVFDDKKNKDIRSEFHINNQLVIGNIGRLTPQKNQDFLLDVFSVIHKKNKESILMIVGVGELEQQLRLKTKKLELEDAVIFTGSRPDVPALLSAMDVFVFPSVYEGLGIAAVEAQAAGLPTICSSTIPAEVKITDLVEFLPLTASAEKWAESVLDFIRIMNNKRPNTQKKIIEAGYDVKETAKWLEDFYLHI